MLVLTLEHRVDESGVSLLKLLGICSLLNVCECGKMLSMVLTFVVASVLFLSHSAVDILFILFNLSLF